LMGLGCDQIAELPPIWDDTNCAAAQERVGQLIDDKQAEIAQRERFALQLATVRAALDAFPPPPACHTDLSCCVPDAGGGAVSIPER
jgi:hypothetical protein